MKDMNYGLNKISDKIKSIINVMFERKRKKKRNLKNFSLIVKQIKNQ